jgi:hypothetical protein
MLDSPSFLHVEILLFSILPSTLASLNWENCTKDEKGNNICKDKVPMAARIAMAVTCLAVLILLLVLTICIVRNRARAAKEMNVEASQVEGPPTIIATEYNPEMGPSPVYSSSKSAYVTPPQMSGPSFPATALHYNNDGGSRGSYYRNNPNANHTAPVYQVSFPNQPYPFSGYSPTLSPSAPKTAAVNGSFPRPMLAGDRLKDRLKERPPSISNVSSAPVSR